MRLALATAALLFFCAGPAPADAPPTQRFVLYKFQSPIGGELAIDDGRVLRSVFSFTDRTSTVPLASLLERGPDGAPIRFQLWGRTSRVFSADDLVTVHDGTLTIVQHGQSRTLPAPPRFFVGSAYAPVAMTQELLRYWLAHGEPASLPVFPIGEVAISRRGADTVTDRAGKPRALERFAIGGLGWGEEVVWLDEKREVAALKGVDTEFDHFEATGRGFDEALPAFVALAAKDGLQSLAATSRGLLLDDGAGIVAYVNALLIDGRGGPPVAGAVVVVEAGKITAAGPAAKVEIPAGARRIDAHGNALLPGLWDMHAHLEQAEWGPVYLAAGVTTVRDCGNELDFIRSVRDTIDAGEGLGPRVLLACIVDGEGRGSIGTERLRTAEEIPALVARFKAAGCAQVKVYQSVDPRLLRPLSAAAHQAGLTVTGHVPTGIGAVKAAESGLDQINHLGAVLQAFAAPDLPPTERGSKLDRALDAFDPASPAARKLAAWFAARHTVLDPTMALRELDLPHEDQVKAEPGLVTLPAPLAVAFADPGASPDADRRRRINEKALALLGVLHKAGVTIVAGTDQAVPGHSLHRELELYVKAGFTPLEALQAATSVPARVMGRDKELGTIAPGKRADFLLVEGDPSTDIRALRRIRAVVTGGRSYDPDRLWRRVGFTTLPR